MGEARPEDLTMAVQRIANHQANAALKAPLYLCSVQAGSPAPADDVIDRGLDLNEHLVKHPAQTFYCRVAGHSMRGLGIFDGDLLIVDAAVPARDGDVVLAVVDGELTCKILDLRNGLLLPANTHYHPISISKSGSLEIEGVVVSSIRYHRGV